MKRFFSTIFTVMFATAVLHAQVPSSTSVTVPINVPSIAHPGSDQAGTISADVIATMRAIREAVRNGDLESWEKLVDQRCQFVEPNGRLTSRSWHAPQKRTADTNLSNSDVSAETKVSQAEVHSHGEAAVLVYREDLKANVGDQTINTATRFVEVYRRNAGQWQLVFSAETPIVEKKAVNVDRDIYADYVGEYQMAPTLIGKVFRDGERLMFIGTGWKQAYELMPLGRDTFFVKEMSDNEIVFIRDQAGKVIAQGPGANGRGPTGKKIK